jgi:hypothetical protein
MPRFVAAGAAALVLGLTACDSGNYAGLSKGEARRQADVAIKTKGPKAAGYTSFIDLRFRKIDKGRFPLGPEAWIVSYSGTDPQSRDGAAMCVWLRQVGKRVTSSVGLC